MTEPVMAYIGIGSNLDNPRHQVAGAIAALEQLADSQFLATSSLYQNPPMGPQDQPDYVNAAVSVRTRLAARELLAELQSIESLQGRSRSGEHWGPRTLDLDLLLYGQSCCTDESLVLPHPGISQRAFVIVPLFEIEPDLVVPGVGSLRELEQATDRSGLVNIGLATTVLEIS